MKLSFSRTLEGHEIEFVRLMYPFRYELFIRNPNANPVKLSLKKDKQGIWCIEDLSGFPGWVNELSLHIQNTIDENEADTEED